MRYSTGAAQNTKSRRKGSESMIPRLDEDGMPDYRPVDFAPQVIKRDPWVIKLCLAAFFSPVLLIIRFLVVAYFFG